MIDLNLSLDCHYAPPTPLSAAPAQGDATKPAVLVPEAPPTFHAAKLTTNMTMLSGTTRMIGMWKPSGTPELDGQDLLQGAFLHVQIVGVSPPTRP